MLLRFGSPSVGKNIVIVLSSSYKDTRRHIQRHNHHSRPWNTSLGNCTSNNYPLLQRYLSSSSSGSSSSASTPSVSGSRSAGLVGMPNVGKSTLFNALVKQQLAQASNRPFTTIEPNVAIVEIPDLRLDTLARMESSKLIRKQQMVFHDIAGLIEGASKGEGLGNAFLGNIRAVSCILHVIRCFHDPEVLHVCDTPDPLRDIRIIENELMLADLQSIEKRLTGGTYKKGGKSPEQIIQYKFLNVLKNFLEAGIPAHVLQEHVPSTELLYWSRLQLLTQKPMIYICNVGEEEVKNGNSMTKAVEKELQQTYERYRNEGIMVLTEHGKEYEWTPVVNSSSSGSSSSSSTNANEGSTKDTTKNDEVPVIRRICAKLEAEIISLSEQERQEYLQAYGLTTNSLDNIIYASAKALRLQTFYTVGPQEARAWTIPYGATAPKAAGVIHSDMEQQFIRAEIVKYDECVTHGSETNARKLCSRNEGKEYIMQDGDVVYFKISGK